MNITGCRALRDEEIEKILAGMDGRHALRDRALFTFLVRTGYRVSEGLSLTVGQVWENGTVKNEVTVEKKNMKGRKKSRTMPLHRDVMAALEIYLRAAKLDHDFHRNTALFPCQGTTKPLDKRAYWRILQEAAKRSGVSTEHLGTHSCRKSFASRCWKKLGGDVIAMATILGHANVHHVQTYCQFLNGELERAVLE